MQTNFGTVVGIALLIAIALIATGGFAIVEPGTVGVVTKFGSVQEEVLQPGLHFKVPIMTKVIPIDTRVQKKEDDATASSKDLQIVRSKVALNYHIDPIKGAIIYSELGPQYPETIVSPAIQESIKSTTSKYTAEQLITQRAEVKEAVTTDLTSRLKRKNIMVTDFSIIDFNFSDEFNNAIEAKQVAEQEAFRAKNDLERIKIEADQEQTKAEGEAQAQLAKARAEAESQQMLRETLTPEVLQLRMIERWDGVLPVYSGGEGGVPAFLSLPSKTAPPSRPAVSVSR